MAEKKSENDSQTLREYDRDHVWHHLTQHKLYEKQSPMMIVKGHGIFVTDSDNKEYLDATSGGVWTVNIGAGNQQIIDAITTQLQKIPYFAGAMATEPGAQLAHKLTSIMPGLSRIYYSSSGSEANEKAYKMVRQLSHYEARKGKRKIIYRDRDYHGTTLGALSSTGHDERSAQYGPFLTDFIKMPHCCCYRCPFNKTYPSCDIECATVLEDIIEKESPETVGSVVVESITAGGGIVVPVPEYLPKIAEICKKHDVYLHIDEVVTGLGRTGKWFGYDHFEITPDMVTLAKGLASGYAAISVLATNDNIFQSFKAENEDILHYFRDISTFGGCTSGPTAALANINIIEQQKLVENSAIVGVYLLESLHELYNKHHIIGEVRGMGLFAGIELVYDRQTKQPLPENLILQIYKDCLVQGVIIGRSNRSIPGLNNILLLCPALICTKDNVDSIVSSIDHSLSHLTKTLRR